jgi:hypothetical protein
MPPPNSRTPTHSFEAPTIAVRQGINEVNLHNRSDTGFQVTWMELYLSGPAGKWPGPEDIDGELFEPS